MARYRSSSPPPTEAYRLRGTRWRAWIRQGTQRPQAIEYAILLLALRAVGIGADTLAWNDVLLGLGIVIILTTIPLTPGNVGIAEVVYLGVFTAIAGEHAAALIAAGVLLSRMVTTWFLPIPIGWLIALRRQSTAGVRFLPGPTS